MANIVLSLDIETIGSIAGIHPMIQLGVSVYDLNLNREKATFMMIQIPQS